MSVYFFILTKRTQKGRGGGGDDEKGKYLVEVLFLRPLSPQ